MPVDDEIDEVHHMKSMTSKVMELWYFSAMIWLILVI